MPRFGLETDLKLIDRLEGLGLRLPFGPYEALLSGVTKEQRILIYGALHEATITDHRRREGHGGGGSGHPDFAHARSPAGEGRRR